MNLVLDIGGTSIKIATAQNTEITSLSETHVIPSERGKNHKDFLEIIFNYLEENNLTKKISNISISMSGRINPKTKRIINSDAYPNWNYEKLEKDILNLTKAKGFFIENDAVCAGLADAVHGEKLKDSMAYIIMGTGIGAVRITRHEDDLLVYPTEFGHIPIIVDGERCICGQRGCLEAYTGGRGLASFFKTDPAEIKDRETWLMVVRYITQGIMNLLVIHNVEQIVMGGGIIFNKQNLLDKLVQNLKQMLSNKYKYPLPEFSISKYSKEPGIYGALALIKEKNKIKNINFV